MVQWLAMRNRQTNWEQWQSLLYPQGKLQRTRAGPFKGHLTFATDLTGEKAQWEGALWACQNFVFNCCIELLPFLTWSDNELFIGGYHAAGSELHVMTSGHQLSVAALRRISRGLLKAKVASNRIMSTVGPSDPQQLLNPNEAITPGRYVCSTDNVHRKVQCLQLALVNRKCPVLLQNDAQPYTTQVTLQKLNRLAYEALPYPPCSPALLLPDHHIFKHLDSVLQEACFYSL